VSALMGLCDLETDMRVTFKAGNLYSEIGHAWPSVSRIICYVPTRQTDRSNVDKLISLCIAVRHPVCIAVRHPPGLHRCQTPGLHRCQTPGLHLRVNSAQCTLSEISSVVRESSILLQVYYVNFDRSNCHSTRSDHEKVRN